MIYDWNSNTYAYSQLFCWMVQLNDIWETSNTSNCLMIPILSWRSLVGNSSDRRGSMPHKSYVSSEQCQQNAYDIPLYWLVSRDPYNGLNLQQDLTFTDPEKAGEYLIAWSQLTQGSVKAAEGQYPSNSSWFHFFGNLLDCQWLLHIVITHTCQVCCLVGIQPDWISSGFCTRYSLIIFLHAFRDKMSPQKFIFSFLMCVKVFQCRSTGGVFKVWAKTLDGGFIFLNFTPT